jgi:hypothetical protein
MKKQPLKIANFQSLGLEELSQQEQISIEGGGFFKDLFYAVGATAKSLYVFTTTAVEYQHSLPANLKK